MGSFELNLLSPIYRLNIDVGLASILVIIILTRDILVFRGSSVGAILCYWSKNGLPISRARSGHTPKGLPRDWSTPPSHGKSLWEHDVAKLDATAAGDVEDRKTGRQEDRKTGRQGIILVQAQIREWRARADPRTMFVTRCTIIHQSPIIQLYH